MNIVYAVTFLTGKHQSEMKHGVFAYFFNEEDARDYIQELKDELESYRKAKENNFRYTSVMYEPWNKFSISKYAFENALDHSLCMDLCKCEVLTKKQSSYWG